LGKLRQLPAKSPGRELSRQIFQNLLPPGLQCRIRFGRQIR
jgi:hypothetical protein